MSSPALPFGQLAEQCQTAGLTTENIAKIAAELSRAFGVHDDEIAMLKIEQAQLKFIYPPKLSGVGMIPLNHSNSVAARTANTKRAEILNNFSQMPHTSIFESVAVDSRTRGDKKPDKGAMVIQKLMTAPVIGSYGVLGVIQVSRKGATKLSAGADFRLGDLQKLGTAANALTKCFK